MIMKLSIIIPVYNTSPYIEQCIRSIYDSDVIDIFEFEVIAINDGSTDDSKEKIEKLQQEFPNLILINKENGGVSSARNVGIDNAKGEYIFFVDSDDFLFKNATGILLNELKEKQLKDLYKFNISRYSQNSLLDEKIENKGLVSGELWRYVFKKKLIDKVGLRFIHIKYGEDINFITKFIALTNSFKYVEQKIYVYREDNLNSAMNKVTVAQLLKDHIFLTENLVDFYISNHNQVHLKNMNLGLKIVIKMLLVVKAKENISDEKDDFIAIYKRIYMKISKCSTVWLYHPMFLKFWIGYYKLRIK